MSTKNVSKEQKGNDDSRMLSAFFNEVPTILDFEFSIKKNIQSWYKGIEVNPKLKDKYQKYIDLFSPFVFELEKLNRKLYAKEAIEEAECKNN